uniref:Uncharacterized protein n=1 Tax=Ciona savignyi TaxID=51511 RepID=H2Z6V0_CIOSA
MQSCIVRIKLWKSFKKLTRNPQIFKHRRWTSRNSEAVIMESLEHMNNSSESKRKLDTEVQEENTKRLKNERAPISKLEKKKNHEFRAKQKGKRNIPLHMQYARKPLF